MTILSTLTLATLAESFESGTLARGMQYAHAGHVSAVAVRELTDEVLLAHAEVVGTAPAPYDVELCVEHLGDQVVIAADCTCPVGGNCKHGAALAVLLTTGIAPRDRWSPGAGLSRSSPPAPSWQRRVERLLAELDSVAVRQAAAEQVPLGLEVRWQSQPPRRRYYAPVDSGPQVLLRPVRPGSRQRWVRSGVGWRRLTTVGAHEHPAAQVDALRDLAAAARMQTDYWASTDDIQLDEVGPRLLTLLGRVVEAGVELVPAGEVSDVVLAADPIDVRADITRGADGATVLRTTLTGAPPLDDGAPLLFLGSPAHTVALIDPEQRLVLARTARPVPPMLQELVLGSAQEPAGLHVPAGSEDDLNRLLIGLGRFLPLSSPDGSVAVPSPVRPVLVVTVTWTSSSDATVSWDWQYADQQCPVSSTDRLGGARDRVAEREVWQRVPELVRDVRAVTGGDALAWAVHEIPALRDLDGVEVHEVERPDFRLSDEVPQISFEVPDELEADPDRPTDWLDLLVTIEVEGERVALAQVLAALTRGDDYLVLPSGLYLPTDLPELDRLREVVRAAAELHEPEGDRLRVGREDLGIWAQLAELGIVDEQAAEWVTRARALRDLADLPQPEPTGVVTALRSYQRQGFHWLAFLWQHGLGGILGDDMGLGKTLQVLALIAHVAASGERRPFLVVTPTSVVSAWQTEAARHTPGLRVRTVARRSDDVAAVAADADVVVTTYALLRLAQDRYATVAWGGLVLDEAQQVKNHRSKTYGAVRRLSAPFRLAVTGTPFVNRLMELWALLSITAPGLYPWPRDFTTQVVGPVEKEHDTAALRRFQQRIRPFLLRRTKELVAADLPSKQDQVLSVSLGPRHRKIYDAHFTRERQRILGLVEDFDRNRVEIFSALTKLRQLALDPALLEPAHHAVGSAKVDLLVEHLAEITAEGHRALVFSQFTTFLTRVEDRLAHEGIATTYLDGATRDRAAVIERFRAGGAPVFLISLKAGGVGLTLTEADYVFVLDPWWNPAAEAQAVDRAHRIGQVRPVHVYRLIAEDTIEEKVVELQGRKAALFAQVLDGDRASAAGITADDIRALFDR